MAKFIYLFRTNPTAYWPMSPEQMQQTHEEVDGLERYTGKERPY